MYEFYAKKQKNTSAANCAKVDISFISLRQHYPDQVKGLRVSYPSLSRLDRQHPAHICLQLDYII
jgi:hypothetical protein